MTQNFLINTHTVVCSSSQQSICDPIVTMSKISSSKFQFVNIFLITDIWYNFVTNSWFLSISVVIDPICTKYYTNTNLIFHIFINLLKPMTPKVHWMLTAKSDWMSRPGQTSSVCVTIFIFSERPTQICKMWTFDTRMSDGRAGGILQARDKLTSFALFYAIILRNQDIVLMTSPLPQEIYLSCLAITESVFWYSIHYPEATQNKMIQLPGYFGLKHFYSYLCELYECDCA